MRHPNVKLIIETATSKKNKNVRTIEFHECHINIHGNILTLSAVIGTSPCELAVNEKHQRSKR